MRRQSIARAFCAYGVPGISIQFNVDDSDAKLAMGDTWYRITGQSLQLLSVF